MLRFLCPVRTLLALQLKKKLLWIPMTLKGTLNYRKQLKLFTQRVAVLSISNFWSYYFAKRDYFAPRIIAYRITSVKSYFSIMTLMVYLPSVSKLFDAIDGNEHSI